MTQNLLVIPTNFVQRSFALVHECDADCGFHKAQVRRTHEREIVAEDKLVYIHSDSPLFVVNPFRLTEIIRPNPIIPDFPVNK